MQHKKPKEMTDKCVFYRSKEIAIIIQLLLHTPRKTHNIFMQNSFGMANFRFWIWAEISKLSLCAFKVHPTYPSSFCKIFEITIFCVL